MEDHTRLLSSSEVAERLGMTQARVRQLAIAGALPATKLGRDWFVMPSDLAAYQAKRPPRGRPRQPRRDAGREEEQ